MLDYERIVDDLRGSLQANTPEGLDFLRSAAADYAAAIDEANERLHLCAARLRQGLRSEAIQLCEVEPNLLDVVAMLDFPEREQWEAFAARYGIAPPPPLLLDVAAELNQAYAAEQPLATLMQQHRLLALARSPLRWRIRVLRQLADVDADNPVWQEDLLLFERERVRHIQQEAVDAGQRRDAAQVTRILQELQTEPWLELPPSSLIEWIAGAARRLCLDQAASEMVQLEAELNGAFSGLDVQLGRRLRDQWNADMAICGSHADPQLVDRASPALAWLASEDRREEQLTQHQAAVAALERALDDERPRMELERLHHDAVKYDLALSAQLEKRCQARMAELHLLAARRTRLIVSAVSIAVVLTAGAVAWVVASQIYGRAVQTAANSVEGLLNENKLTEAREYLERLQSDSPRVAAAAEVQEVAARLEGLMQKDADRRAAFVRVIEMLRASMPDADRKALGRAKELAKTHEERVLVLELESAVAGNEQQLQHKADQDFAKALEPFATRLNELSNREPSDPDAIEKAVLRIRAELAALESSSGNASAVVRDQLKPMWSRVAALEDSVKRSRQESSAEASIVLAVGDVRRYRDELSRYVQQFPGANRSTDFKRVLEESPLWEGRAKWNEFAARWQEIHRGGVDSKGAQELLALLNNLVQKHGNHPDVDACQQHVPYLEAIGRRMEGGQPIQAKLKQLFRDPLLAKGWMIVDDMGQRYYLLREPSASSGPLTFRYVAGFDLKERSGVVLAGKLAHSGPAPQVAIAKAANELLATMADDNWEATICRILRVIHDQDSEQPLDPLLKVTLLLKTLEVGCQGSSSLQKAFDPHVEVLKRLTSGQAINWLDPRDGSANSARAQVASEFGNLPDLSAAIKAAADQLTSSRACPARNYQWIGWLCRTPAGTWRCSSQSQSPHSGRLYVIRRQTPGDKVSTGAIGKVENGTPSITTTDNDLLIEGRPVYLEAVETSRGS